MNLDTVTAVVDASLSTAFSVVPDELLGGISALLPALVSVAGLLIAFRFMRRWAGL